MRKDLLGRAPFARYDTLAFRGPTLPDGERGGDIAGLGAALAALATGAARVSKPCRCARLLRSAKCARARQSLMQS